MKRRLLGGLAVAALTVLSIEAARSLHPYSPLSIAAPSYRDKGEPSAPVLIVEYSDFQCPACKAAESSVAQTLALYGTKVRFVFKDFPLERIHHLAHSAAIAAECAGQKGKFWPYHDLLYANQEAWSQLPDPQAKYLEYAKSLGLQEADFKACLANPATDSTIKADIEDGNDHWIQATPTFFINGRRYVGGRQFSELGPIWIDKILKNG